jgi:hypothetical protein
VVIEITPPPEQKRPRAERMDFQSLFEDGPIRKWLRERETIIPRPKLL